VAAGSLSARKRPTAAVRLLVNFDSLITQRGKNSLAIRRPHKSKFKTLTRIPFCWARKCKFLLGKRLHVERKRCVAGAEKVLKNPIVGGEITLYAGSRLFEPLKEI
jgi:hypothetical protein